MFSELYTFYRSPKQQRISLVARQSQFAQNARTSSGLKAGKGKPGRSSPSPGNPESLMNQGSTTSINSGFLFTLHKIGTYFNFIKFFIILPTTISCFAPNTY